MEKNVNQKGYATVEAALIVPMIMVIVCVMLVVLIGMFRYSHNVMTTHKHVLKEEPYTFEAFSIKAAGYKIEFEYTYDAIQFTSKELQEFVEYIMYLIENYYGRLKGIKNDQK